MIASVDGGALPSSLLPAGPSLADEIQNFGRTAPFVLFHVFVFCYYYVFVFLLLLCVCFLFFCHLLLLFVFLFLTIE